MDALGSLIIGLPVLWGIGAGFYALAKWTGKKAQTGVLGGAILIIVLGGFALFVVTS